MSETEKDDKQENVFAVASNVGSQLQAIEQFMARRFDEISMEINATSQQVDMAEEGIITRFSEILEILHAVSYSGDGKTPANAGVELDAVVDMTEEAANKILDAAGRINTKIHSKEDWENKDAREKIIEGINNDVEEIFMACSFQDITGQRIRKTLENLKTIEDRLGVALDRLGINVSVDGEKAAMPQATSQEDIDALFKENSSQKD
ncbi:MAG: hypothetical protein DHS20C02_00500 [Micavibrio sp.]|nr:MAG: hypothetical protein DHS20C02_00500 [Micavibrio sp.]